MTLAPTVAVDCCLKDDGLRLFLGLSSNNTLRPSLCVYFIIAITIIIIVIIIIIHSYIKNCAQIRQRF